MPGHEPNEAVHEFLDPLEDAAAVLDGFSKLLVLGKKGLYRVGQIYMWSLNGEAGMPLRSNDGGDIGIFRAAMHFEVIEADPAKYGKPYRVTTRGYSYGLEEKPKRGVAGNDLWRMDWHPNGRSPVDYPHLHIAPNMKAHQPTPRLTFEKAVEWCIGFDAKLCCSPQEALSTLLLSETNHRLNRTWNERPGEPVG
ncbi:hypothetical protein [Amycolatopsis sp. NPDC051371]|uniref:hypothetical protein n=1 Tax=Amycolatopsis sp. NPDC051371 TaxID=3155800 RepID=UPI0034434B72